MQNRARATALALITTLSCVALSCSKKGSPPKAPVAKAPTFFLEAVATQDQLVATVVISSVGGTIQKLSGIAGKLQLPSDAAMLRSLVVGPLGLPDVVWTHIDEKKPMALAVMAGKENTGSPTALAAQAKSNKDAQALVAALGQKLETRDGAVRVKRPDDSEVWLYVDDDDVFASLTFEGLKVGGAHALASRTNLDEDVLGTIYPEAMAKANATTVRQFATDTRAQMMEGLRAQSATTPSPMPFDVTEKMIGAFLDPYFEDLADTKTADFALLVNDKDGVVLRGRAHPKADSAFARRLSNVVPYKMAPGLASEAAPTALFAAAYTKETLQRYKGAMAALASVDLPGMQAVATGMSTVLDHMGTAYSGEASFANGLHYSFVGDLSEGADPNALMDAMDLAFGPKGLALLMKEATVDSKGGKGRAKSRAKAAFPAPVWKRQGLTARLEMPLAVPGEDKRAQKQMHQLFGGDRLVYTFSIVDNKFFGVVHPQPDAELARLTKAADAGAVHPAVASALDATKGSEAFVYFDLLGFVRPFMQAAATADPSMARANAMMGMMPGLATLSVPMIFSYRGGDAMSAKLLLPMNALENVAHIARPFLGMMAGGAAPGATTP